MRASYSEVLLVCMPPGGIRETAGAYESHVRKRKEKKKKEEEAENSAAVQGGENRKEKESE